MIGNGDVRGSVVTEERTGKIMDKSSVQILNSKEDLTLIRYDLKYYSLFSRAMKFDLLGIILVKTLGP